MDIWQIGFWLLAACILVLGLAMAIAMADDFGPFAYIAALAWFLIWLFGSVAIQDEIWGNHPTFELRKDRWACTARHTEVSTSYISDGKGGMTPIVNSYTVCDQYSRIQA